MVHQVDMERFTFLFLCGKRDRRILQGKEKMTFSDLDRLTYVTDFLGLTRLNLDIWHHYGEQFQIVDEPPSIGKDVNELLIKKINRKKHFQVR